MKRSTVITALALVVIIIVILVALFMEASAGPTFRAEDHASYEECVQNIPTEWAPGSLQRTGARDACMYVHRPSR